MWLSCPSKTFIVGEYAVLAGAPAILYAHQPYFKARLNPAEPFHTQSPAGLYLQEKNGSIEFQDPHSGKGGFGGSSAEFLLAYCLVNNLNLPLSEEQAFKARDVFLSLLTTPASGVDIVCQSQLSGIYFIDPKREILQALPWPFVEYELHVEHTGLKIKTHDHLAKNLEVDHATLENIVLETRVALIEKDLMRFSECINNYQKELQAQQLTHPNTLTNLQQRPNNETQQAIKGCGAFGADVILTVRKSR